MTVHHPLLVAATVILLLLSCRCHPASSQSVDQCTPLLGGFNISHYPRTTHVSGGSVMLADGYYVSPIPVPAHSSFVFTYTIPDQRGLESNNRLRFAVYSSDSDIDTPPALIAQSQSVPIKDESGRQTFTAPAQTGAQPLLPNIPYMLAVWSERKIRYYRKSQSSRADLSVAIVDASQGFPIALPKQLPYRDSLLPPTYQRCAASRAMRNFAFTGFQGQKFLVKGQPNRVYSVLSLPSLQLNTRFISLVAGQAMNSSQQANIRARHARLLSLLSTTTGTNIILPSTVAWSHDGLYMGETGVQLAGHRLLLRPGGYLGGFETIELDGVELAVTHVPQRLVNDGSVAVRRSANGVVEVLAKEVQLMLVNSDHFINLHSATLNHRTADPQHIDGLLGQTARPDFQVLQTAEFKERIESDFLLPKGENDIWSITSKHNQFVTAADVD